MSSSKQKSLHDFLEKPSPRGIYWFPVLLLTISVAWVYSNTFQAPFLLEDHHHITGNSSIQSLWPLNETLQSPTGEHYTRRPVVYLTLALNYGLSGFEVWSYHAFNVLIHLFAAWTLFGVVRRALLSPRLRDRYGAISTRLALAVSLLWASHPLQTEAVTYIIQRAESLMGLFFLLTFYCAQRGWASPRKAHVWFGLSILACLLGVGTNKAIAAAPLFVLLYDLLFQQKTLSTALRGSRPLYIGLFVCWMVLALWLVLSVEFDIHRDQEHYSFFQYAITQPFVIFYYLRLAFWPNALCFDYGWGAMTFLQARFFLLLVLALLGLIVWGIYKRNLWAFLGAWFFLFLAPTSSFFPSNVMISEYRMYLPLAALVVFFILGVYEGWNRYVLPRLSQVSFSKNFTLMLGYGGVFLLALTCGSLAYQRNEVYRSAFLVWKDTLEKSPNNPRAYTRLGVQLNQPQNAIPLFEKAIELNPEMAEAHYHLGRAWIQAGQPQEAIDPLQEALHLREDYIEAWNNLGVALIQMGEYEESIPHLEKAILLDPEHVTAHLNVGVAHHQIGEVSSAIEHYQQALKIKPDFEAARTNLEKLRESQ